MDSPTGVINQRAWWGLSLAELEKQLSAEQEEAAQEAYEAEISANVSED